VPMCRLGECRVAQPTGFAEGVPNPASGSNEAECMARMDESMGICFDLLLRRLQLNMP
jgi:hypothetical protein